MIDTMKSFFFSGIAVKVKKFVEEIILTLKEI